MHRRFVAMKGEAGGRLTIDRPPSGRWWRSPACVLEARLDRPGDYYPATEAEAQAHRRRSLATVLITLAILWAAVAAAIAILSAAVPS